jgi:hypothetical protein
LLEEHTYLCSTRSMYRIPDVAQEVRERRHQARHPAYAKPELVATAPNQIWSWDITKLKGPIPYFYYSLYVLLDGVATVNAESGCFKDVDTPGTLNDVVEPFSDPGSPRRARRNHLDAAQYLLDVSRQIVCRQHAREVNDQVLIQRSRRPRFGGIALQLAQEPCDDMSSELAVRQRAQCSKTHAICRSDSQ